MSGFSRAGPVAAGAQPSTGLHRSFLIWQDFRYLKAALALAVVAIGVYWFDPSGGPPNGGTWLGYTLGAVGFALIFWLAWFGIRRRLYGRAGSLEGLLSAHVYLGLALIVVATLHTGFRFHWNVHTFAFALMAAVVASGVFGAWAFWRYPPLMTENRGGATLGRMAAELAALDLRCREVALAFPGDIARLVTQATAQVGRPDGGATLAAIGRVQQEIGRLQGTPPAEVLALVQLLTARVALLDRLARDRRFRALMLLWRAVHVPLTVGLLVALSIHVFVVFYDW